MALVIVSKYIFRQLIVPFLFILFLNIENTYAQIIDFIKDYKESINIQNDTIDKISIFIFVKSDNKNLETNRLLNNLNTLETLGLINFDIFKIIKFSIT